ncbi:sugar phosphate isomerase/epimerase [Rubellicoccus peritrichatus]|uniref:Sugar phosphate isomerase/epimerase n=1 Tax=Rubellicoccus peritrichatus TaxID=3080537 RepID=A0AAQ3LB65_9BACT|nr:sugar phosphate isomerase/epimerase [Puniceicoccus sp. CR14]WOO41077.1 sugar phosphate isomerase/epimerase [Puniceicoccus sp. CR14]
MKRASLVSAFKQQLENTPEIAQQELNLSWSNWGFGMEPLETTAQRLEKNNIHWIELHGNQYGDNLGYQAKDVLRTLGRHNIKVAGLCGMFGSENDLSSNSGISRQNAIDYIRRQLELGYEVGASYMLVVPGAVGRAQAYDDNEFERSVETLRIVADDFIKANIRAAIEPIRSAEVSFIHTIADAKRYIAALDHPGVQHINADIYHMQSEESNIPEAILDAGDMLINLHLADSNRCALGEGSIDLDAILMALYVLQYCDSHRFATPEPLGPGGDPYPAMFGKPNAELLDKLVAQTASYWRKRENHIKALSPVLS